MSLEKRRMIEREVNRPHTLTGIAILTLAVFAGVSRRAWREWQGRRGQETRHNGKIPREHWTAPAEEAVIAAYCKDRMERSYRVLCRQMVDANIAAARPATVYTVLKRGGLTKKWAEMREETKSSLRFAGFEQPKAAHEQWHRKLRLRPISHTSRSAAPFIIS